MIRFHTKIRGGQHTYCRVDPALEIIMNPKDLDILGRIKLTKGKIGPQACKSNLPN